MFVRLKKQSFSQAQKGLITGRCSLLFFPSFGLCVEVEDAAEATSELHTTDVERQTVVLLRFQLHQSVIFRIKNYPPRDGRIFSKKWNVTAHEIK